MASAMRVACDKESNGNGGKSDGDKGSGQAMAMRAYSNNAFLQCRVTLTITR
jgi:hypothetical protein